MGQSFELLSVEERMAVAMAEFIAMAVAVVAMVVEGVTADASVVNLRENGPAETGPFSFGGFA